MNVSYAWLRSMIPGLADSPAVLADRLAMYGAPVDEIVDLGTPLADIVTARVIEARQHPNADRLSVCTVDDGTGEPLNVVCGAPNVRSGGWYPFIRAGGTLPGGMKIRRAKIRGEESNGMLCSPRELGLGRDHDGILELHGEFKAGASFIEQVGLADTRIAIDVTPNRSDLLSHWGVARELSPDGEASMVLPSFPGHVQVDLNFRRGVTTVESDTVRITLENGDDCPRYMGAVVRGVAVGPSPEWLASRLRGLGLRPINNVVDATNYVLFELGQPMHAFDLGAVGGTIEVRRAKAGESLQTLDGEMRKLTPDVLVIADAERPVALAGIMGGRATEVTQATTDLFVECALFAPKTVRAGRRLLDMSTDASYRFERGVDPEMMERSVQRVVELILSIAGGKADADVAVADTGIPEPAPIRLRQSRVIQVLGVPISREETAALLEPIGFPSLPEADDSLRVRVPGHRRNDVQGEDDLVEEVARRRGYDTFPDDIRAFRASVVPDDPISRLEDRLRERLVGLGFFEARCMPLVSEAHGDVALLLPLASTESRLRRALLPGLARRVEANFNRGARDVRLFEIGTTFQSGGLDGLPRETTRVAVIFAGSRNPPHWTAGPAAADVWDLRGVMAEMARILNVSVRPATPTATQASAALDTSEGFTFVRGSDAEPIGAGGRVVNELIDAPAWADTVWGAEVSLHDWMTTPATFTFQPLPSQPAVERDVALLLPAGVLAGDIEATVAGMGIDLLESLEPFDVYRGDELPDRARSVAFRLRFRAPDRTLTVDEVDSRLDRILKRLKEEHDAERRG